MAENATGNFIQNENPKKFEVYKILWLNNFENPNLDNFDKSNKILLILTILNNVACCKFSIYLDRVVWLSNEEISTHYWLLWSGHYQAWKKILFCKLLELLFCRSGRKTYFCQDLKWLFIEGLFHSSWIRVFYRPLIYHKDCTACKHLVRIHVKTLELCILLPYLLINSWC